MGISVDVQNEMAPEPSHLPYVEIIEQPAPYGHRFRYSCEQFVGIIPGVNSSTGIRTYPTIKINNHIGTAEIVVSCVTKDPPYLPHPNKLVGTIPDNIGFLRITRDVKPDENEFQIKAGVLCMKRSQVADSLQERRMLSIDPFNTGFPHIQSETKEIDSRTIRLCFQVFIEDDNGGPRRPLPPIVSDIVSDRKPFGGFH